MAQQIELKVPDIGDFKGVEVIEVLVKPGDRIDREQSVVTLESDKASMEVPASHAGVVKELKIKVGDKVSEGSIIALLDQVGEQAAVVTPPQKPVPEPLKVSQPTQEPMREEPRPAVPPPVKTSEIPDAVALANKMESDHKPFTPPPIDREAHRKAHASPAVRFFARELGVDLNRLQGSGPKGRILKDDIKTYVKAQMEGGPKAAAPAAAPVGGMGIPPIPAQDFSKWGEVEVQPLPRIKKISGAHLHRCWLNVPHVTQFDEADITEMEEFRKSSKDAAEKRGVKLTPLAFLVKAAATALVEFPSFNSSLTPDGESLVFKKYVHIGVAVDTPNGLVVPVIRDANKKGLFEIAADLGVLSKKARDGKLGPSDMQGGTFSISSLGGIGGTSFTPIVNAPEVAILGVSRSSIKPVWNGKEFAPRLMLPFSLSYDHRGIDGAAGARFTTYLADLLGDIRRLLY
jgi:pyruvate dehydrogenase E2 component (dihydrolipoamide acetyltransferase)